MPLLEFDRVGKVYGRQRRGAGAAVETANHDNQANQSIQALSQVSLSISPGRSLGVIGESGAGKTTLAAIATGLTNPTSGRVFIEGKPLDYTRENRRRFSRQVQLVWQDAGGSVDPRFSVRDILAEPLRIHRLIGNENVRKRVGGLLAEVGLSPDLTDRYPHELSGGELQRLVIARALALDPALLICDEPASALDAISKMQVAELLISLLKRRNLALMVIAHDLPLVRKITDELIVMYRGVIVERGPTAMIAGNPLHPYTRLLLSCDPSISFQSPTGKTPPVISPGPDVRQTQSRGEGPGCVFRPACGEKNPVCSQRQPELFVVGDGRQAACELLRDR